MSDFPRLSDLNAVHICSIAVSEFLDRTGLDLRPFSDVSALCHRFQTTAPNLLLPLRNDLSEIANGIKRERAVMGVE